MWARNRTRAAFVLSCALGFSCGLARLPLEDSVDIPEWYSAGSRGAAIAAKVIHEYDDPVKSLAVLKGEILFAEPALFWGAFDLVQGDDLAHLPDPSLASPVLIFDGKMDYFRTHLALSDRSMPIPEASWRLGPYFVALYPSDYLHAFRIRIPGLLVVPDAVSMHPIQQVQEWLSHRGVLLNVCTGITEVREPLAERAPAFSSTFCSGIAGIDSVYLRVNTNEGTIYSEFSYRGEVLYRITLSDIRVIEREQIIAKTSWELPRHASVHDYRDM